MSDMSNAPVAPVLKTPKDYGLPDKFNSFRPGQQEIIEELNASTSKLVMLSAPVGSGKSAIGVATGHGRRTLYLCTTKQLQDQIAEDFPNAVILKGRANYPCLKHPGFTAEACDRAKTRRNCISCKFPCKGQGKPSYEEECACVDYCEYIQTKRAALVAPLVVLNTHLFMTEANLVGGFSGWPYMIIDEADMLESALMSYIELSLTKRQIHDLGVSMPAKKTVPESWVEWISKTAIPACQQRIEHLQSDFTPQSTVEENNMTRLMSKLKFAAREIPGGNWVFIPDEYKWTFKPVFVRKYAQRYLWDHTKRVLAMSATLVNPSQMCRDLGFDTKDADLYELDSTFPIESRRIHFTPYANITFKTADVEFPKVIRGLDEVIANHPDEKILVHAVSYANMNRIVTTSRHVKRMIWHKNSEDRNASLELFRNADYPAVLVSPSMERGVDLPYDACRVVVLVKVPYASLGDKQIAARVYGAADGSEWYATNTIRSIVQATGRATRAADDYSKTYILDGQFERIYREHGKVFPKWWREALVMNGGDGVK